MLHTRALNVDALQFLLRVHNELPQCPGAERKHSIFCVVGRAKRSFMTSLVQINFSVGTVLVCWT